jgi:PhoD-like phosphatase.
LLSFVQDADTRLVSLSGDNHNSFAGLLHPTFKSAGETPIGAEISVCGISSPSLFRAFVQVMSDDSPLRPLIAFDGRPVDLDVEQVGKP